MKMIREILEDLKPKDGTDVALLFSGLGAYIFLIIVTISAFT